MGSSGFLPRVDIPFTSSGLLEGEEAFSPSTKNEFVSVARASGLPAVGVRLVPWLDSVEEAGLENFTFFFRSWANLIASHRRCIVDFNVIGVLPREVAQEVMVPTKLFHEV